MKKLLDKICSFLLICCYIAFGFIIGYVIASGNITMEKRESYEYANLLKCEQERYDYCPYCGEALHYEHHNLLNEDITNRIINEYLGD